MELLLLPFQAMGLVFITLPPAALAPALLFTVLHRRGRRASAAVAAVAWAAYAAYESAVALEILCGDECSIRIELLAIYPLLLGLSAVALIVHWRAPSQPRG